MNEKSKKIKNLKKESVSEENFAFDFTNASSITECTGLTPTPPKTDAEKEAYLNIYDYNAEPTDKSNEKRGKTNA